MKKHSAGELSPGRSNQQLLQDAINLQISGGDYKLHLQHLRDVARDGANLIFSEYKVDVIIAPADSPVSAIAAGAGYPIATMPLGHLDQNGTAFGMVALTHAHQEAFLLQVMSAWDKTFSPVKAPLMPVD